MVEAEPAGQHGPDDHLTVNDHRPFDGRARLEIEDLRLIDERGRYRPGPGKEAGGAGQGNGTVRHIRGAKGACARPGDQILYFPVDRQHALAFDVADHRHHQGRIVLALAGQGHGNAHVDVVPHDDVVTRDRSVADRDLDASQRQRLGEESDLRDARA